MDRLFYELRLLGWGVMLTPLLIILAMGGLAFFQQGNAGRTMSAALEMMLPLVAGVTVGMVASRDHALELQLTLPRIYRRTALLRIALLVGWIALLALLTSVVLAMINLTFLPNELAGWSMMPGMLANQLTWSAPLFWFMGIGLLLALLFRNPAAPGGTLASLWIADILFYGLFVANDWLKPLHVFATTTTPAIDFWWWNRLILLGTGMVALFISWLILHNTEGLLKGAVEE